MENLEIQEKIGAGPFIEILSGAEDVRISEIPSSRGRKFFISLMPRTGDAAAHPTPEEIAGETNGSYSRDFVLRNAGLLVDSADYVLARNLYSFLLKRNIRDTEGLRGLGICVLRMGELTSARKCFKALTEIAAHPEWEFWLGMVALAEKNEELAIAHFTRVGEPEKLSKTNRFELYRELGNCYARVQKHELAEACYDRALSVNPEADLVHVNWGMVEIQKARWNAAAQRFERALQLNPRNHRALVGLGIVASHQDAPEKAKERFIQALNIDSASYVAIRELITLAPKLESLEEVKERILRYLEKSANDHDVRYSLAAIYFKEGQWSCCLREIVKILKSDSAHKQAREMYETLNATKHR